MSYSSTDTSSSHNNEMEGEVMGSRPIECKYNLPSKRKKRKKTFKSLCKKLYHLILQFQICVLIFLNPRNSNFLVQPQSSCKDQKERERERDLKSSFYLITVFFCFIVQSTSNIFKPSIKSLLERSLTD